MVVEATRPTSAIGSSVTDKHASHTLLISASAFAMPSAMASKYQVL
jgi:hypothetical protein